MSKRPNMRTLQMQDTIDRQKAEIWRLRSVLVTVSTAIEHDKDTGTVWLSGIQAHADAVTDALDWSKSHTPWMGETDGGRSGSGKAVPNG